jgi:hypothetical protein
MKASAAAQVAYPCWRAWRSLFRTISRASASFGWRGFVRLVDRDDDV